MNYQLLDFPVHGDHGGNLIALEKGKDFPFDIKRVYYIYGTKPNIVRGKHAHKNLEQVIVCVAGSCDFVLDNGHIDQIGTHEELLKTNKIYQEVYYTQNKKDGEEDE